MAANIPKYRADLSYSEPITAEKIIVKYDGTSYDATRNSYGGYGNSGLVSDASSTGDPFYITAENGQNVIYTDSEGQHTIEISENTSKVETTECFKKAVKSVGGGVMMLNLTNSDPLSIEGATWQEAYDALQSGTMVFLKDSSNILPSIDCAPIGISFGLTRVRTNQVNAISVGWSSIGTVTKRWTTYTPQS